MAGKKGRTGINGANKTGPKRTDIQRELDRKEMVRLMRRGWTQSMIAEKLGVHQTQIHHDWKIVLTEMQGDITEDNKALRANIIQEYSEIAKEAWEAWERSKLDHQRHVEENIDTGDGERLKTIDTTEGRLPGSEYLRLALACIDAKRELLGINPIKQIEVTGHTTQTLTWDTLAKELQQIPGEVPDIIEAEIVKALPPPSDEHTNNGSHSAQGNGKPLNGDGHG